ncbi:SHOCT domain-containing protein [Actinacidiphila glaucinigra]|uniref:SHOCT domain-containing protein n=1 Tax=Actinacidiphila glaucinigra TaxID=235986 RepID=UPI00370DBE50
MDATALTSLADHWDGGPGPWILFFPLIWAAVIAGVAFLLRRTMWRRGPGRGPWHARAAIGEHSPIAVLGRRFAAGEIDEDEYWRRLSVLDEQFGRFSKGGER